MTYTQPPATAGRRRHDEDARQRLVALSVGVATALVLLPAIVATTLTGEWRWLAGGAGAWITLCAIGSCVAIYRYGHRP